MNVEGKKVLVVGTGKSGIAAAALLAKEKAAPFCLMKIRIRMRRK